MYLVWLLELIGLANEVQSADLARPARRTVRLIEVLADVLQLSFLNIALLSALLAGHRCLVLDLLLVMRLSRRLRRANTLRLCGLPILSCRHVTFIKFVMLLNKSIFDSELVRVFIIFLTLILVAAEA